MGVVESGGGVECASNASQVGIKKEGGERSGTWGLAAQHTGISLQSYIFR